MSFAMMLGDKKRILNSTIDHSLSHILFPNINWVPVNCTSPTFTDPNIDFRFEKKLA
jgi:hypothetical protein